jgi:imidazolonepropionase-like amidohydrolase
VAANRQAHRDAGVLALRDVGSLSDAVFGLAGDDLPRVQAAGRILAPAGHYFGFQQPTEAADLVATVRAQAQAGAPWVKIIADFPAPDAAGLLDFQHAPANYPPDVLRAAVEEAHKAGARVAVHAVNRAGIAAGVAAGVDSIEHGTAIDAGLLDQMAAAGIAWTPTLLIPSTVMRPGWVEAGQTEQVRWVDACMEALRALLPRARARGVRILAGTDALPHGALPREIAALHAYGLSPADALAAASTEARAFLGLPDLEEGAPADLVLYRADPRHDPEVLAAPALVMVGGVVVRAG